MNSAPPRSTPPASSGPAPAGSLDNPDWRVYAACAIIPVLLVIVLVVRIIIEHPKAAGSTTVPTTLQMTFAGPCPSDPGASLTLDPMVFEAKATSVTSSSATLERMRIFTGEPSPQITVTLPSTAPAASLKMPTFTAGSTYLIAVDQAGSIVGCGVSGVETSALESVYNSAVG